MSFKRAQDKNDPNRCQAVNSLGQCLNLGVELPNGDGYGSFCLAHGGRHQQEKQVAESLRNYKLNKWHAKLNEKAESDVIKSLRDEIGILRICLEERLNRCEDATDLILQSGPISDMVMKINTVVQSCHKLEGSMGQLLDKQAILQFAHVTIGIIGRHLEDQPERINLIADDLLQAVGKLGDE